MKEVCCVEFAGLITHRSVLFFIQIPYHIFESYVHHVAAGKLVNIPTKMAASSVERCLMDGLWS